MYDRRNAEVWATEWAIARAGGRLARLSCGQVTHDCAWHDLAGSHVIWARRSWRHNYGVSLPCAHRYECVASSSSVADVFPERGPDSGVRREWAMWSPLDGNEESRPARLKLRRVSDPADWEKLLMVRSEVEAAFGGSPAAVRMVEHIRHRLRCLTGDWYLGEVEGVAVGEIGLVIFETATGKLGRLQDVDIRPSFQGRGLGRELLAGIRAEARRRGCAALCLRADADDWPKDWYARSGFEQVGEWARFETWEIG